jgi:hypothetical protein
MKARKVRAKRAPGGRGVPPSIGGSKEGSIFFIKDLIWYEAFFVLIASLSLW